MTCAMRLSLLRSVGNATARAVGCCDRAALRLTLRTNSSLPPAAPGIAHSGALRRAVKASAPLQCPPAKWHHGARIVSSQCHPTAPADIKDARRATKYLKGSKLVLVVGRDTKRSWQRACAKESCGKSARGATDYCVAHGGGRRCQHEGCDKSTQGATDYCVAHGGGRRCQHEGCDKSATGATDYCVAHGGGQRCDVPECDSPAYHKGPEGSSLCRAHAVKQGVMPPPVAGYSREAMNFFEQIWHRYGHDVGHRGDNEKRGLIQNSRMRPDGYDPNPIRMSFVAHSFGGTKGTVWLYHGDFFHGYPPWHPAHESRVNGGKWGPDCYRRTVDQMDTYVRHGYTVLYIFGSDVTKAKDSGVRIIDVVREHPTALLSS